MAKNKNKILLIRWQK